MLGLIVDLLNSMWWWPALYCYLWWQDQIWSPIDIMTGIYNRAVYAVPAIEAPLVQCGWWALKTKTVVKMRLGCVASTLDDWVVSPIRNHLWPLEEVKDVHLVRDGEIILSLPYLEAIDDLKNCSCDMVLYEWRAPDKEKFECHVIRSNTLKDLTDRSLKFSSAVFNAACVTLKGSDDKFQIEFNKKNYSIIGNVLFDRTFVKYWLKTHYNGYTLADDQKYVVAFLDGGMIPYTVAEDQYVTVSASGFTIVSNHEDVRGIEENIAGDAQESESDEDPISDAGLVNLVEAGDTSWLGMGAFYRWTTAPVTSKKND